ncbi:MAG: WhiB family transcriptional regulator [Egibacteraceae bacterium]
MADPIQGQLRQDWRSRAACQDVDPEQFFPIGASVRALEQTDEAKQVCAVCPVRAQCLAWALATGQHDGVWGGMSEDERRVMRRAVQRACRMRGE